MDVESKAEWELVSLREDDVVADILERIAVPGGWLYRSHIGGNGRATCTICFVPDQEGAMSKVRDEFEKMVKALEE